MKKIEIHNFSSMASVYSTKLRSPALIGILCGASLLFLSFFNVLFLHSLNSLPTEQNCRRFHGTWNIQETNDRGKTFADNNRHQAIMLLVKSNSIRDNPWLNDTSFRSVQTVKCYKQTKLVQNIRNILLSCLYYFIALTNSTMSGDKRLKFECKKIAAAAAGVCVYSYSTVHAAATLKQNS